MVLVNFSLLTSLDFIILVFGVQSTIIAASAGQHTFLETKD